MYEERYAFTRENIDTALQRMSEADLKDLLTSFVLDRVLREGVDNDWALGVTVTKKTPLEPYNGVVPSDTTTPVSFDGEEINGFVLYTSADLRVRLDGDSIAPGWTGDGFFCPGGGSYSVENISVTVLYLRSESGNANVSIQPLTLSD